MKKLITLCSVLIQLSVQEVALARPGQGGPGRGDPIKALDKNGDNQLSQEEVQDDKFFSEKFSEIDTDKNGLLSKEELDAHRKAHKPARPEAPSERAAE